MAACLVTVAGTSGVIRINYTISSVDYVIETSVGSFYIEDTATDVTYTTLSGDLVASSGCLTITEAAPTCYKVNWTGLTSPNYVIDQVILGSTVLTIADTAFPNSSYALVDSINNLNDDSIKVIGYKIENRPPIYEPVNYKFAYILKVLGTDVPILRVRNADNSGYIYIYGVVQPDCLPQTGFTIVDPCYSALPPAP